MKRPFRCPFCDAEAEVYVVGDGGSRLYCPVEDKYVAELLAGDVVIPFEGGR